MDNGLQSCGAGTALHHYVEVRYRIHEQYSTNSYSSDIPSGSACGFSRPQPLKYMKKA